MNPSCLLPAATRSKKGAVVRVEHGSVMCYVILCARNLVCGHGARRPMTTKLSYNEKSQRLCLRCCPYRALALVKRIMKVWKFGEILQLARTFCLKSLKLNLRRRATLLCESSLVLERREVKKSGQLHLARLFPRMLSIFYKRQIGGQRHQEKGRSGIN